MKELIKDIQKKSPSWRFVQKYLLNKYFITIFLFLVWMIFFDSTSWLVIKDLNKEIDKYEEQRKQRELERVQHSRDHHGFER